MSLSQRSRQRRRETGGVRKKALLTGLVVLSACGLVAASVIGWVVSVANSAPAFDSLKELDPGQNSEVLAADGTRLGFISADNLRLPVNGDQFPKVLKDATVAIEDQRFYKHKGVDYEGLLRAAVKNVVKRKTVQGGSTLTMQLVRNLYTGEKQRAGLAGYERKIKEAKLAQDLEDQHSKAWILDKYLNTVPYGTVGGQTSYGAGAAARTYFNKRVDQLTLREAALLAGLPQAPSAYSPSQNPTGAKARRDQVLGKMADLGMISRAQAERTMSRGLGIKKSQYFSRRRESYFFDYVKDELIKEYGGAVVGLGGLKVHTTIDLKKQKEARAAINAKLAGVGPSSAIVTIDPGNGDILAMASSADYGKSKFNLAAQGHRQPGSVFKVMALMTALRQGINPNSTSYVSRSPTIIDDPEYGHIEIKTYGGTSGGTETLTRATLKSDNSVYIQLALDVGPKNVVQTAHDLGITTKLDAYAGETLGGLTIGVSPLEVANAFATIASGGWRNRPRAITKVEFPDGRSELPKRWRKKRVKAFEDGVTYEATKILEQNIQGGTGTKAQIGCPAGGKTGTTDHNVDAWFAGFTPRLATAVWVGFPGDSRVEMNSYYHGGPVDGGTYPAEIWGAYMKVAKGGFCGDFPQPQQPFQSVPFSGKYTTHGSRADEVKGGAVPLETQPGATPTPGKKKGDKGQGNGGGGNGGGAGNGGGNGGATFDPNQYESPPQGTPGTGAGGTTPG
jgi:penicillin-binding protein 1A